MKIFLLSIFSLFFSITSAQQNKLDSLLAVNEQHRTEDSVKVRLLINVFRQYSRMNDLKNLEVYAQQAIAIAQKLPRKYCLSITYEAIGRCYHGKSLYLEAVNNYNKGIEVAKSSNDYDETAGIYLNLSALYSVIPDYPKALEANEQAVKYYNLAGDRESIGGPYINIGATYIALKQYVKAADYFQKALTIFNEDRNGINYGAVLAQSGLADAYLEATNEELLQLNIQPSARLTTSLGKYQLALRVADQDNENSSDQIGVLNSHIGEVYEKMHDTAMAVQYYKIAVAIAEKGEDPENDAVIFYTLGKYYSNIKNYNTSKYYLNKSLSVGKENNMLAAQQDALEKLSSIYQQTGRNDSALLYYQQFIAVRDSIFSQEKEKEITRRQLQLDFRVKEHEYKLQQEITDVKLQQQKLQISFDSKVKFFLIFAFALLIIITTWILYSRQKTRKLNRIINIQKAELEQLGQVKDKIFSIVSHDMRSPVNSLMSFIDILDNGNIPQEKLTLYAKELRQNLSYTSALMNNLLNWAGSQMQGFKPYKENIALKGLIDEVAGTLQHHLQQKRITIQNNIASEATVYTDRNMLSAILRNLISNATKFSQNDTVIHASATLNDKIWQLSISDEGTGMDEVQLAQINSGNYQPAESKRGTANEKGTGLGLLLCKTFIAQLGGKIEARNNEGAGVSFVVTVPGE